MPDHTSVHSRCRHRSTIMLNAMKSKPLVSDRSRCAVLGHALPGADCFAQTPLRTVARVQRSGSRVFESRAHPGQQASPPYCLVQGMINKRIGAGGKQFGIGFELRLPDIWTERFLFQGGGGMDGVVRPATGAIPISGSTAVPALARGFAVATTDSGHQGQGGPMGAAADASFGIDQQARVDQAYGGFMAVTELARQMIVNYYGQPWKKSYFMGCSNGGRQALLAAQRFPLAFDGVMSVAPAARVGTATISSVWETIAFSEIAPQGRRGTADSFQGVLQCGPNTGGQRGGSSLRFEGRR